MPVRSPHGRAAAYRAIWQWPLRSPARLIVTVAVALALVTGLSYGIGALRGPAQVLPAAPTTVPTAGAYPAPDTRGATGTTGAPAVTALPPVTELSPTTLPISQAPPEALQVVTSWTAAWVRPPAGTTSVQWLAGLRPYTTDEYLGVLSGVDPSNVPATRVTGAARATRVAARSVQVQIPTDALTLLVTAVSTEAGWRVSGYDRA
jgi:hypothetical protein